MRLPPLCLLIDWLFTGDENANGNKIAKVNVNTNAVTQLTMPLKRIMCGVVDDERGFLYYTARSDGGSSRTLLKIDLATDTVVGNVTYPSGNVDDCESAAINYPCR